jgi:hypothetical protein
MKVPAPLYFKAFSHIQITTCPKEDTMNLNPIGCFTVTDDEVWKVIGFLDNFLLECVEYLCEREDPNTGLVERKTLYEDYEENIMFFSTWEQAELCRMNLRMGNLESFLQQLSDTCDEVREAYGLY